MFSLVTTPAPAYPQTGRAFTLAADELLYLGPTVVGIIEIVRSDASIGIFDMRGGFNATVEVRDSAGGFSNTKDTALMTNVYYDAAGPSGAGYYIQHKPATTRSYRLYLRGALTYPF